MRRQPEKLGLEPRVVIDDGFFVFKPFVEWILRDPRRPRNGGWRRAERDYRQFRRLPVRAKARLGRLKPVQTVEQVFRRIDGRGDAA